MEAQRYEGLTTQNCGIIVIVYGLTLYASSKFQNLGFLFGVYLIIVCAFLIVPAGACRMVVICAMVLVCKENPNLFDLLKYSIGALA